MIGWTLILAANISNGYGMTGMTNIQGYASKDECENYAKAAIKGLGMPTLKHVCLAPTGFGQTPFAGAGIKLGEKLAPSKKKGK